MFVVSYNFYEEYLVLWFLDVLCLIPKLLLPSKKKTQMPLMGLLLNHKLWVTEVTSVEMKLTRTFKSSNEVSNIRFMSECENSKMKLTSTPRCEK